MYIVTPYVHSYAEFNWFCFTETDRPNIQETVVVNFGGFQGLEIGGGAVVMAGKKGNNPPVR